VTRAFVALLLDEAMRASVGAEIDRLRPLSRVVAWVPTANLHLTLRFLGERSDEQLGLVEAALVEAAAVTAPFALTLHGLGAFPGLERPRILWVGIADGALPAREVQARVETALERRGIARERQAWHPHLTIGRIFDERAWRREAGLPLRQALAAAARRSFGSLAVSRIALMRSDLSPQGARYRELASAELTPGLV
jgi:RNA 2',3'-cyclic 3'-phosphodiesterase